MLCAILLAYLPALRGALLWDDDMHVTRADLRSLHGLWRIWFDVGATPAILSAAAQRVLAGAPRSGATRCWVTT